MRQAAKVVNIILLIHGLTIFGWCLISLFVTLWCKCVTVPCRSSPPRQLKSMAVTEDDLKDSDTGSLQQI